MKLLIAVLILLFIPFQVYSQDSSLFRDNVCEVGQFTGWAIVTASGGDVKYEAFETLGRICKIGTDSYELYRKNQDGEYVPFDEQTHVHYMSVGSVVGLTFKIFRTSVSLVLEIVDAHAKLIASVEEAINISNAGTYSEETLYGQTSLDGVTHTASIDVKRLKSQGGLNHYVVFENFKVEPEFERDSFQAIFQFMPVIGGRTFPDQEVSWLSMNSNSFRLVRTIPPEAVEFYFSEETRDEPSEMLIRVLEKNWFKFHETTAFFMASEEIAFPPKSPTLTSKSGTNSIELKIDSNLPIDNVEIYRSENSNFSIENSQPVNLDCEGQVCKDFDVQGGKRYYYKAIAINQAGNSNPSNEVSGMPSIQFRFADIHLQKTVELNSIQSVKAKLYEIENENLGNLVLSGEVSIHVLGLDWRYKPTEINSDGTFEIDFRAPARPGSYTIELTGYINSETVIERYPIRVNERPEKGYDIALTRIDTEKDLLLPGDELSLDITIQNNGIYDEESFTLYLSLLDQYSEKYELNQFTHHSLSAGSDIENQFVVKLPENIDPGNYVLEANVINNQNLDEFNNNNRILKDIYINEDLFTFPVFRTDEYSFSELGQSISIAGGTLFFTDIRNGEVLFEYNSETTGYLKSDNDEGDFWLSSEKQLFLLPIQVNNSDTSATVRAGGIDTGTILTPDEMNIGRGYDGSATILLPDGREIVPASINFPFGTHSDKFSAWNSNSTNTELGPNEYKLNYQVPKSEQQNKYESWIQFRDQAYTYFTKRAISVKPIHDVALNHTTFEINPKNQIDTHDLVAGISFVIDAVIYNNGDYVEKQPVFLQVKNDNGFQFSDDSIVSLEPGEQQSVQFEWNTFGLEPGTYTITLTAPHSIDLNLDNTLIGTLDLIKPPPLDVLVRDGNAVSIGEDLPIEVFVGRNNNLIPDANVVANIEHPDGFLEKKRLLYNEIKQIYETNIRANIGGNYHITAIADHAFFKEGTGEGVAKSTVDVTISDSYGSPRLSEFGYVDIYVSNVSDVHAFAVDIVIDDEIVNVDDFIVSDFLKENGEIRTSKQISNQDGKTIIGISRLGKNLRGITTFGKVRIGTIVLNGISIGNATVRLENLGIVDSRGESMVLSHSGEIELPIKRQEALFQFSDQSSNKTLFQTDTLDVILTHAYQVQSVSGKIMYDQSKINVVNLIEGDAVNRRGSDETVSAFEVDDESGSIEFGISRQGSGEGVNISSQKLLSIVYEPVASGNAPFEIEDTNILSANGLIELPSTNSAKEINIGGTTSGSEKATVGFNPNPVFSDEDLKIETFITLKDAMNVNSFASDIIYDPNILEFIEIEESNFFNENGDAQTSLNYTVSEESGTITLGLTRLGSSDGINAIDKKKHCEVAFQTNWRGFNKNSIV